MKPETIDKNLKALEVLERHYLARIEDKNIQLQQDNGFPLQCPLCEHFRHPGMNPKTLCVGCVYHEMSNAGPIEETGFPCVNAMHDIVQQKNLTYTPFYYLQNDPSAKNEHISLRLDLLDKQREWLLNKKHDNDNNC